MRFSLQSIGAADRSVVNNAGSLVATTVLNSGLGFIYWWVAARHFQPSDIGFAAASISAMMLLGNAGMLGLGTLLIGELPRQSGQQASLIATALLTAGIASAVLGLGFSTVAPKISLDLEPLSGSLPNVLLFTLGVSFTAVALVLDKALIGLLRGDLQLGRNALFSTVKLGALLLSASLSVASGGLLIHASWVVGTVVSLAAFAILALVRQEGSGVYRLQWVLLRGLRRAALEHHALNLALAAPTYMLPIVVTAALSASTNAYFYSAWMVATVVVFIAPGALTTAVYAVGARAPAALAQRIRFTLPLALLAGLLANGFVSLGADAVLGLFGSDYAERARWPLGILALAVFPQIVKDHYVAIVRVNDQVGRAAFLAGAGGLLEVIAAAIGAAVGGLAGLTLGWLAALCAEAAVMGLVVFRTAAGWTVPRLHSPKKAGGLIAIQRGNNYQFNGPADDRNNGPPADRARDNLLMRSHPSIGARLAFTKQLARRDPRLLLDYLGFYLSYRVSRFREVIRHPSTVAVLTPAEARGRIAGIVGDWQAGPALSHVRAGSHEAAEAADQAIGQAMAGDISQAELAYGLVRAVRPDNVIEAGVGPGLTSAYVLAALADNGVGKLYSVDLPPLQLIKAGLVGAAVPEELRDRWVFYWGSAERLLSKAVRDAGGSTSLFIYDADLRYRGMRSGLEFAWSVLRHSGWLIVNDVHRHTAFDDLVKAVGAQAFQVAQSAKPGCSGILIKPVLVEAGRGSALEVLPESRFAERSWTGR